MGRCNIATSLTILRINASRKRGILFNELIIKIRFELVGTENGRKIQSETDYSNV
jgi:hypothetical protein